MRLLFSFFINFCLWSTAFVAHADVIGNVRWLDPAIDCSKDFYPYYTNPFNVYAQTSQVLKKKRPDGVLFFTVNIVFGHCSPSERAFVSEGSRHLTVLNVEKWPWQQKKYIKEVKAYEQTNVDLLNYNKLEIRVDEKLLADELQTKETISVVVGYHDFNINGVRLKWIFENSADGIKARIEAIR